MPKPYLQVTCLPRGCARVPARQHLAADLRVALRIQGLIGERREVIGGDPIAQVTWQNRLAGKDALPAGDSGGPREDERRQAGQLGFQLPWAELTGRR